MIVLATYHPAAILHARSNSGGLSKETLLRAIQGDIQRLRSIKEGQGTLVPPVRGTSVASPSLSSTSTPNTSTPIGTTGTVGARGTTVLEYPILSIDTEYSRQGEMYTCALSNGEVVYSWDKDLEGIDPSALTGRTTVLLGHNIPEDLALLWEQGLIPRNEDWLRGKDVYDSLLLAKMNNESLPSYKLEDLLAHMFTVKGWKKQTEGKDVEAWTPEERRDRCEKDAWAPAHIVKALVTRFDTPTLQSLYPFTQAIAMTLHRMTLAGAVVDRAKLDQLVTLTENQRRMTLEAILHDTGRLGLEEYDPHNDHDTRELLFERLKLQPISYTKKTKVPQVTKEVLEVLAEDAPGETKALLANLVLYNQLDKRLSTYLVGNEEAKKSNAILRLAYPVDLGGAPALWLPFRFNSLGARTSRRSSSNPNSQNWPKLIRALVRSRWQGGSILAADYRKLEPVIIAWLAGDERLLEYFTTGEGYLGIARDLLRTDVKEGTPLYRGVKSIVLGVHYDMRTDEMARQLWYHHKIRFDRDYQAHWNETNRIRYLYLDDHPLLTEYMARRMGEAQTKGYVTTPTGRVRRVGTEFIDKHALNQVINAPVQSTASDVTGSALIDVEDAVLKEYGLSLSDWMDLLLRQRKFLTRGIGRDIMRDTRLPILFNEVHDELTVDLPPENRKRNIELVVETMRAVPTVRALAPFLKDMPLGVDPKVGPAWGLEG